MLPSSYYLVVGCYNYKFGDFNLTLFLIHFLIISPLTSTNRRLVPFWINLVLALTKNFLLILIIFPKF